MIQNELRMLLQRHDKMHTTANSSISFKKICRHTSIGNGKLLGIMKVLLKRKSHQGVRSLAEKTLYF